jgi:CSLREA domain-containing protein
MIAWLFAVAAAADLSPTTFADGVQDDGLCTLREAILAANTDAAVGGCPAGSGADRVLLTAGTYRLSVTGARDDVGRTGDLDVHGELVVLGHGRAGTVIDGNGLDRVFHGAVGSDLTLVDLTVTGGQTVWTPPTTTIDQNNLFALSHWFGHGGGGVRAEGDLTLRRVAVTDNRTATGERVVVSAGASTVPFGGAGGPGGGVLAEAGLWVVESRISSNHTGDTGVEVLPGLGSAGAGGGSGGGLCAARGGEIRRSLIDGNVLGDSISSTIFTARGGGLVVADEAVDPLVVVDTTLTANHAGPLGAGGGAWGNLQLEGVTVTGNTARVAGGAGNAVDGSFAPLHATRTVFVGNTDALGSPNCLAVVSGGYVATVASTCLVFAGVGDLTVEASALGTLGDNGGPLPTIPLPVGSPLIDAGGDCTGEDQRGARRPNGGACDIGAFEAGCGDDFVSPTEDCDDGSATETCTDTCATSTCGDGVVNEPFEQCDPGDGESQCRDCQWPACGDGVLDVAEVCDDEGPSADCDDDCTEALCGDGVVNDVRGERCDDGPDNDDFTPDACRTDCLPAFCGDGVRDAGESCDDGPANSDVAPNACRTDCSLPTCGDGGVDAGEACDDGPANNDDTADACRTTCVAPWCGDGVLDGDEGCDDGPANNDDTPGACRTTCDPAGCGDGVLDVGEACDDGGANSDDRPGRCRTDCQLPRCGDGALDLGEDCDDGPANSDVAPDACRADCSAPTCGDGVVDGGEGCDDGTANADLPDACRTDCAAPTCGDGLLDAGEACDDGPANSDVAPDACRTDCTLGGVCGDGAIDVGEACDDGNTDDGDGCTACAVDPRFVCVASATGSVCDRPGCGCAGRAGGDAWLVLGLAPWFTRGRRRPRGGA